MDAIKMLETIQNLIPPYKGDILLVYGGLKPSCFVELSNEIHELITILDELGLYYRIEAKTYTDKAGKKSQEVTRLYIARDQDNANRLASYFKNIINHDYDIGILLGYPKTAVEAFVSEDMLDMADIPESTSEVTKKNMRLLGYRLSKTLWEDEVKQLEEYGNYLLKVSPTIYTEITLA